MSRDIVTEQITLMGNTLLCSLLQNIKQNSPAWYAIMGDEASDIASREQLNISIRWVNESMKLVKIQLDCFASPTLLLMPFVMLLKIFLFTAAFLCPFVEAKRTNMQGCRNCVATQIKHESPSALSVHCFAHKLNLCLQDVGKQLVFLQDALEVVREIAKLIKFSPKELVSFHKY